MCHMENVDKTLKGSFIPLETIIIVPWQDSFFLTDLYCLTYPCSSCV